MKNVAIVNETGVVGVPDEQKVELYDKIAQFLANEFNATISHVKPNTIEVDGKKKKTGGYGLAFNYNEKFVTVEVTFKKRATIDDYVVTDETTPD